MSSSNYNEHDIELLDQAHAHLWKHMYGYIIPMTLKWAVELNIPDIIHNHAKPMTIDELLAFLPINLIKAPCVYRFMRILTHSGFFALTDNHQGEKGYELTPPSLLLIKSNPFSQSSYLQMATDLTGINSWHYLSTWFQNDDLNPFYTAHGTTLYDYAKTNSKFSDVFNESMGNDSRLIFHVMIQKCRAVFEGLSSLVDIGGGNGMLAKSIAQEFPQIECVVFDLPHVVAGLRDVDNLKFVCGDMFQGIPSVDAILLKWILHNWTDVECLKILKKCKEALSDKRGGKVILIEMVMSSVECQEEEDENIVGTKLGFDLSMMVLLKGRQRSEKEWAKLFSDAGFKDYKITRLLGLRSLIEVFV
ncbi:hypothetical protein ACFE04_030079 [Oxalis oulophora]